MAVFNGGATLEAIEHVIRGESDAIDALTTLVNHSLIRQQELPDGHFRFAMLQTVRDYGLGLLERDPGREALLSAHADYYLTLLRRGRESKRQLNDAAVLTECGVVVDLEADLFGVKRPGAIDIGRIRLGPGLTTRSGWPAQHGLELGCGLIAARGHWQ